MTSYVNLHILQTYMLIAGAADEEKENICSIMEQKFKEILQNDITVLTTKSEIS